MDQEAEKKSWAPPGMATKPKAAKDRHDELVEQHRQDLFKFDYYFAAVALGVLSFSVSAYKAPALANLKYLHAVSWACYLLAFLFAIVRIERLIGIRSLEVRRHSEQWYRDAFKENVLKEMHSESPSPEFLGDPAWYKDNLAKNTATEQNFIDALDRLARAGVRYYRLMMTFFVLGLILTGTAKLWEIIF